MTQIKEFFCNGRVESAYFTILMRQEEKKRSVEAVLNSPKWAVSVIIMLMKPLNELARCTQMLIVLCCPEPSILRGNPGAHRCLSSPANAAAWDPAETEVWRCVQTKLKANFRGVNASSYCHDWVITDIMPDLRCTSMFSWNISLSNVPPITNLHPQGTMRLMLPITSPVNN